MIDWSATKTLAALAFSAFAALSCSSSTAPSDAPTHDESRAHDSAAHDSTTHDDAARATHSKRPVIDGRGFPDKVIALTWDDGPDAHTAELAEYLSSEHVSGTFFVVDSWVDGVSSEPGRGARVFQTGHAHLPVLQHLVSLGHRVANHTRNHVLLTDVPRAEVQHQLASNQRALDPYIIDETRLFRAPGGWWNAAASEAVDSDPMLSTLTGPVGWDIDKKDWESSLYCRSSKPGFECEHTAPEGASRVRASVIARRYVDSITSWGHGVVLMHDRVGHVGSTFALDIAHILIPELKSRGFVFAAPVLAFSPLTSRGGGRGAPDFLRATTSEALEIPLRLGDLNGDGRADICGMDSIGIVCAHSELKRTETSALQYARFTPWGQGHDAPPLPARNFDLADLQGDGRLDLCTRAYDGIACASAAPNGGLGPLRLISAPQPDAPDDATDFSEADGWDETMRASIHFADVDGDGRADACGLGPRGVVCAHSHADGLDRARGWLDHIDVESSSLRLADVNGDGRADLCGRSREGLVCAISTGHTFSKPHVFSTSSELLSTTPATLRFGDLNGDGRADVCGLGEHGVVCALSGGHMMTEPRIWISAESTRAQGWESPRYAATIQLGDINGDGRADLCGSGPDGVVCGVAP
jgi:peptidoglycan/xylan/chitin deacetylase (PgdA/CDA1 family)